MGDIFRIVVRTICEEPCTTFLSLVYLEKWDHTFIYF